MGRKISKEKKVNVRPSFVEQLIATGFFVGYVPVAPATWACFISIIIWYFTYSITWLYIGITLGLFILGIRLSGKYELRSGKDPHCVVIDEYASFLLPLYFVPRNPVVVGIAFVLFRIFDILKPPPLRHLERIPGGLGVMLDDLGAAVYTTISIIVLRLVCAI